jgi:hypothetical protein
MVPELSIRRENGFLNTHWVPYFRGNSSDPYDPRVHEDFWTGDLLYDIAGNFPCVPSFGMPGTAYGVDIEAHATTAHGLWEHEKSGVIDGRAAYTVTSHSGGDLKDLSYRKVDLLLAGHPVHYTVLTIRNSGSRSYRINAAWHNTIAPPFLEKGCLIDLSADRCATVPSPNEFDETGRLEPGREFDSITEAPLRGGKSIDVRPVPGMIGYTDFITGAVPNDAELGWSTVVNPGLEAIYMCFFKGPKSASEKDVVLYFNDLWMQYGGRRFTPWAATPGGSDLIFCLGTENSVSAFANGLEYALAHPTLLGSPTSVEVPAGGEKVLYYGTLAASYEGGALSEGVSRVEPTESGIDLVGYSSGKSAHFNADAQFAEVERLAAEVG